MNNNAGAATKRTKDRKNGPESRSGKIQTKDPPESRHVINKTATSVE